MKKIAQGKMGLWILVLCLAGLLIFSQAALAEKVKVRVGHIVHLTGAYAAGQVGLNDGFLDACAAANKHMDLNGIEIVPVWMDGGTDVAKSMQAFKKMIAKTSDGPMVAMVGESTTIALALKKWYIKKKVPCIEGGSDDALFTLPSWTFSDPLPYVNELGAWVDYYLENIWPQKGLDRKPRFAWLTWEIPFGRASITPKTKAYLAQKGVEVVGEEFVPFVPTDVSAQLMRLKEKKVDFTYGAMYHNAMAVILKEADKLGMIEQMDIGMAYAVIPKALLGMAGALARNIYITSVMYPKETWADRCPRILEAYNNNKNKDKLPPMAYSLGFIRGLLVSEAVRIAAKEVGAQNVDGEAVYRGMQKITNFDAWGVAAPYTFTEKKRYGQDTTIMIRLNDNKVNMLGEFVGPNLTKTDWK